VGRLAGSGRRGDQEQQGDGETQRRLTITTAASTRPKAAASFQRSRSPSQSQANAAKMTSVMISCATVSCAALNCPYPPHRFAGTWRQYSKNASAQDTRIAFHIGALL
jgi:hypothetical protein